MLKNLNIFQLNFTVGAAYTGWKLGKCDGNCGIGSRLDARDCVRGNCKENLSRTANCTLPNACKDECERLNLKCSKHATCAKLAGDLEFICECMDGFTGTSNGSPETKTNLVVLALITTIQTYFHL